MKVGTDQVKHLVLRMLKKHKAQFRNTKYGDFADELVEELFKQIGDDMNKSWNLAHGFPPELEGAVRRFEKELGILLKRTPQAQSVYEFILSEEAEGRKFSKFANWAKGEERVKYISKYFNKPEYIQVDWQQAFIEKKQIILEREL